MNSFRVVGTKFRILKGGKIGLSFYITLAAGTVIIGNTSLNAADNSYFNTNAVSSSYIDATKTVTKYSFNSSLSYSQTHSSTDLTGDVYFNPYGVASSYVGVYDTAGGDTRAVGVLGTDSSPFGPAESSNYRDTSFFFTNSIPGGEVYYATSNNIYTSSINSGVNSTNILTFSVGANANDIIKNTVKNYSVDNLDGYTLLDTGSTLYTANLIFNGSNTISGNTDIDNGNIQLNGGVTFEGSIESDSINVGTSGQVILIRYQELQTQI